LERRPGDRERSAVRYDARGVLEGYEWRGVRLAAAGRPAALAGAAVTDPWAFEPPEKAAAITSGPFVAARVLA
jgi:hypothetical protein